MRPIKKTARVDARFDAETVVRTATVTESGRFEIELRDEAAPYVVGGFRRARSVRK